MSPSSPAPAPASDSATIKAMAEAGAAVDEALGGEVADDGGGGVRVVGEVELSIVTVCSKRA
jgi:hypothetical protein